MYPTLLEFDKRFNTLLDFDLLITIFLVIGLDSNIDENYTSYY